MNIIKTYRFKRRALGLSESFQYQKTGTLFTKALYLLVLVKLCLFTPIYSIFNKGYYLIEGFYPTLLTKDLVSKIFYFPIVQQYHEVVIIGCIFIVIIGIVWKPSYVLGILIYLISFNFSKLTIGSNNGGDLVLNLFLFLSVFFNVGSTSFQLKDWIKISLANFMVWICRIQIGLIYLVSGYDKLGSTHWRSGAAIPDILKLDFFIIPDLFHYPISDTASIVIAWSIIFFEFGFIFLITYSKLRPLAIALGILMHIGIIVFLSLPDFGLVMIASYLIYLPEKQAEKVFHFTQKSWLSAVLK